MNFRLFKGYFLATAAVGILAVAAFVVLTNLGDEWTLHVIWKSVTMRRALWLLVAGVSGAVVWWTIRRLVPNAVATLREGTKLRKTQEQAQQLKDLQQQKKQDPKQQ